MYSLVLSMNPDREDVLVRTLQSEVDATLEAAKTMIPALRSGDPDILADFHTALNDAAHLADILFNIGPGQDTP